MVIRRRFEGMYLVTKGKLFFYIQSSKLRRDFLGDKMGVLFELMDFI